MLEAVGIVDAHLMATLLSRFKARQHLFALKRYLLLSQASPQAAACWRPCSFNQACSGACGRVHAGCCLGTRMWPVHNKGAPKPRLKAMRRHARG